MMTKTCVMLLFLATTLSGFASSVAVTTSADAGPGSLRQALLDVSGGACGVPCRIEFALPPDVPCFISTTSPLPDIITPGLTIDASPHGCAIMGTAAGFRSGLRLVSVERVSIRGLTIMSFAGHGIFVDGGAGHVIEGNHISDSGLDGIAVRGSVGTRIEANRIMGSRGNGIYLLTSHDTIVHDNSIGGGSSTGELAVGNNAHGIHIQDGHRTRVENNRIASNGLHGVLVTGSAHSNTIQGNSIEANGLLGIDLGGDGPDLIDGSGVGPNRGARPPVLEVESGRCADAHVRVRVHGSPLTTYVVETFATNADDGFAQGARPAERIQVETDHDGRADGVVTVVTHGAARITATATSETGDTSEFSLPVHSIEMCADLSVSIQAPRVLRVRSVATTKIVVVNAGPAASAERVLRVIFPLGSDLVRLPGLPSCAKVSAHEFTCTVPALEPRSSPDGRTLSLIADVRVPAVPETYRAVVTLESDASDGNRSNDEATVEFAVTDAPDLTVKITERPIHLPPFDPGAKIPVEVIPSNVGATPATNVVFTLDIDPPAFVALVGYGYNWICTGTTTGVVCRTPLLEGGNKLLFEIHAPDTGDVSALILRAAIDGSSEDFNPANNVATDVRWLYRARFVTNTNDDGEGSLRRALLALDDLDCTQAGCKVLFRIPSNEAVDGVYSIRPERPLPPITKSRVIVDGYSQSRFTGDTNPEGPEIEINGSRSTPGDGLTISGENVCGTEVRSVVLNGWPGSGISFNTAASCSRENAIIDSYVGTDPGGMVAVPNGDGVSILGAGYALVMKEYAICHSECDPMIVSGNRRNGIRARGDGNTFLATSIGIGRDPSVPVPNGAAGLRLDDGSRSTIWNCRIAHNDGVGIVTYGGSRFRLIDANSIADNGGLGIDVDGDGVSRNDEPDMDGLQNFPEILGVEWDEVTDTSTIRMIIPGYIPPLYPGSVEVMLYQSDEPDESGFGEGAARVPIDYWRTPPAEVFTIDVRGDYRRTWLSATATLYEDQGDIFTMPRVGSSSEFGPAFRALPD